jgi:hypothetical protein
MEDEKTNEVENFPLDEATISVLADIKKAREQIEASAISLEGQRQGALIVFLRQHKLDGDWRVADNGRELVKAKAPAATPAAADAHGG